MSIAAEVLARRRRERRDGDADNGNVEHKVAEVVASTDDTKNVKDAQVNQTNDAELETKSDVPTEVVKSEPLVVEKPRVEEEKPKEPPEIMVPDVTIVEDKAPVNINSGVSSPSRRPSTRKSPPMPMSGRRTGVMPPREPKDVVQTPVIPRPSRDEGVNQDAMSDLEKTRQSLSRNVGTSVEVVDESQFRAFKDLFVSNDDGEVVYNNGHAQIGAKTVPKAVCSQIVDDLKSKYLNKVVIVDSIEFTISENNSVFNTGNSLFTYLAYKNLDDKNLSLSLARQTMLIKLESKQQSTLSSTMSFPALDIYVLLLAATTTEKEPIDRIIVDIKRDLKATRDYLTSLGNHLVVSENEEQEMLLGLLHGNSWLINERLAILKNPMTAGQDGVNVAINDPSVDNTLTSLHASGSSRLQKNRNKKRDDRRRGRR